MGLDDDFRRFAMESREFQGKAMAWMQNHGEHLKAVSNKADDIRDELQDHAKDDNAHGLGGERRGRGAVVGAIGAILGAIVAAFTIMAKLGKAG